MTSSPTPSSPIRSKSRAACALLACAGGLFGLQTSVHAHGGEADPLPAEPGVRVGVAGALRVLDAPRELPSQRLPGFLLQGDAGMDARGAQAEHAVLDAGWRLHGQWGAYAALGKHGGDPAHFEAAWLQWQPGADWRLTAGRQRPALGAVVAPAGHLDRFALVPLAKQASFGHDWIDDGVQLGWRRAIGRADLTLDAGLWRGRVWPGGAGTPVALSLHGGVTAGDFTFDAFAAHFEPTGRGTRAALAGGGHSHAAPVCDEALKDMVCFAGRSQVLGASARWLSHDLPLSASAAMLWHRDRGPLRSRNGLGDYGGDTLGGWVEGVWAIQPQWELGARLERLQSRQRLQGAGVSLIAAELGLNAYRPANRAALMLGWLPREGIALRLEVGTEAAGGWRSRFAALRAVFRIDDVAAALRGASRAP